MFKLEKKSMSGYVDRGLKKLGITISKPMLAIICIIFGMVVIFFPGLLVWIVGLFLIVQGTLLLTDLLERESQRPPVIASKGVYCSHCGTRNIEEALYCKKCGEKFEQASQKKSHRRTKRTP